MSNRRCRILAMWLGICIKLRESSSLIGVVVISKWLSWMLA